MYLLLHKNRDVYSICFQLACEHTPRWLSAVRRPSPTSDATHPYDGKLEARKRIFTWLQWLSKGHLEIKPQFPDNSLDVTKKHDLNNIISMVAETKYLHQK